MENIGTGCEREGVAWKKRQRRVGERKAEACK